MEEPLYSSRSIKIFAKDHDSLHTTRMNSQGDWRKHEKTTSFLGSKSLAWRDRLQTWFKSLGSSCGWRIHIMCGMIRTSVINKGKETTLISGVSRIIHSNIYGSAHEPQKDSSNIQNTYFVMKQSWFLKVSNISAKFSIWIYPTMEKIRMLSMGSTTTLSKYSKTRYYLASTRKS
jgi:hypothetical protein